MKASIYRKRIPWLLVLAGALAALSPRPVAAQSDPPKWINVRVIQVKANRVAEWEGLQKRFNEALKTTSSPGRDFWQVIRGQLNTYHIVTEVPNLGQNDQTAPNGMEPAEWAQWQDRVADCVGDRQVLTLRNYGELSIPPAQGRKPKFLVLSMQTNGDGQFRAYYNHLKDNVVPALKKGGVNGRWVSRVFLGDDSRTWATASLVDKWEDFEGPGPLTKSVGAEEAAKIRSKGTGMITSARRIFLTYREDLSFQK